MAPHYDPDNGILTLAPDDVLDLALWVVWKNQTDPTAEGEGLAPKPDEPLVPIDYDTPW